MISFRAKYEYVISDGTKLFTAILLPSESEKHPSVVIRTPYVDALEKLTEEEICAKYLNENVKWLERGYALVIQHCRGRGKSDGDCVPYINERKDSLCLYDWIRAQDFYNGEIFLRGGSYLTSVHYCAAPYADDIKGAIFARQDTDRYNVCYRNGFLKKALHGNWYVGMYKAKTMKRKNYTPGSFETLPLSAFTRTVFGESVSDFDEMLRSPNRDDPFWSTHAGGAYARDAFKSIKIPVLITTSQYDIYTGGMFDLWRGIDDEARKSCALLVSAYDHSDKHDPVNSITFPKGKRTDGFGEYYEIDWFDHIRLGTPLTFEKGRVTYYELFENVWKCDDFEDTEDEISFVLGKKAVTYTYNPYDPPRFKGGLSCNFGGSAFQDKPNSRHDIISVYTDRFERDVFVKGKMSASLRVRSDCPDTCFYVRVSIDKGDRGDFGLRDDITSLVYQLGDYTPNTDVRLEFNFDEHAFRVSRGERLRVDIASADADHYVRHTNNRGLYSEQTTARVARNTVYLQDSILTVPIENK